MQRKYLIAAAIFVALFGYVLLTQTGDKGMNTLKLPKLPKVEAKDISQIIIASPAQTFKLEKIQTVWKITQPIEFAAQTVKVENLGQQLAEMQISDLVAEQAEENVDYGLNSKTAINLNYKTTAGKEVKVIVGRTNDLGTHTFLQLPKDKHVYQILGDLKSQLAEEPKKWRSLEVLSISPDEIKEFSLQQGKENYQLQKIKIEQPIPAKGTTAAAFATPRWEWVVKGQTVPLIEPKVNQLLNEACRLNANEIVESPAALNSKPLAIVSLTSASQIFRLEFINKLKDPTRYWVRRADTQVIYEIPEFKAQMILKKITDLR
jgi:hypothetical protein